jgi:TRAP transporter TAXI family solute receptor
VHIVVRQNAGIRSIAALKGRRVSVGEEGSGTLATARIVMRGYGLAIRDLMPVYERLARSAEMLATGEIDAFFMVGGPPIAAITHIAERVPLSLLPISGSEAERIFEKQRFFSPTVVPDNAYLGVPATETISVGAHLMVSSAMDEKLVYAITRVLWDPRNRRVLDSGSPNGQRIQLRTALDGLAVPLHDGARRFYAESGITQAGQR